MYVLSPFDIKITISTFSVLFFILLITKSLSVYKSMFGMAFIHSTSCLQYINILSAFSKELRKLFLSTDNYFFCRTNIGINI